MNGLEFMNFYKEVEEEGKSLQGLSGVSSYDNLIESHKNLCECDLRWFYQQLRFQGERDVHLINVKQIKDLGNKIQDGVESVQDFMDASSRCQKIKLEKAQTLCDYIVKGFKDFQAMVQGAVKATYAAAGTDLAQIKEAYEENNKSRIENTRQKLDKLVESYTGLAAYCDEKNISIDLSKESVISKYIDNSAARKKAKDNVKKVALSLENINWSEKACSEFKSKYEHNFAKGRIKKKNMRKEECEKAGYYEGAIEAVEVASNLKYLIKNWASLKNQYMQMIQEAQKAGSILQKFQQNKATIGLFRELLRTDFSDSGVYSDIKPFARDQRNLYKKMLKAFGEQKERQAKGLAKKIVTDKGDEIKQALESENLGEIESALVTTKRLLEDVALLSNFADVSKYDNFLVTQKLGLFARRDEIAKKYDLDRQREEFEKKEEKSQKKIKSLIRRTKAYASCLEDARNDCSDYKDTVKGLLDTRAELYDVMKEMSAETRQAVSEEISGIDAQIRQYARDNDEFRQIISKEIDLFDEKFDSIDEKIKEYNQEQACLRHGMDEIKKMMDTLPSEEQVSVLDKKFTDFISRPDTQADSTALLQQYASELNKLRSDIVDLKSRPSATEVVYVKPKQYHCKLNFALQGLATPKGLDLIRISRKLSGENGYAQKGMIDCIRSAGKDFMRLKPSDHLSNFKWAQKVFELLEDDIDNGSLAQDISSGKVSREEMHEILECIDGYLERCRPLVDAKKARFAQMIN